ncbi:DegT/DnrJ/EryC1/StrS family aminotransferase [Herbaspirillum sp. NPDC087042]|uniref:DegT/DnrJ/EryC1/StrS family aminotransferase n=1 Tax=Herbaspirillum sp. NPDC087042 TaxID=3364004 RepID=UPI00382BECEA
MTKDNKKPVYVTRPFLPPLEEFNHYLEKIWHNQILTNGGPFHEELEQRLAQYLGVEHVSLFSNGTLALITALQALEIAGEVITTPYSFVATTHALHWNRLTPVFVDIEPDHLTLDPAKIEAAITEHTKAILPVHCYGYPCKVEAIQKIADKHGLKVIYDAAHAFGVRYRSQGLLAHGDLAVLSFHATKVFNTFEGGAIISRDAATKLKIDQLKNFGSIDETTIALPGINAKMSEVNAAMGLLQMQYLDSIFAERQRVDQRYRELLRDVAHVSCLLPPEQTQWNHAYFPILINPGFPIDRDELYQRMRASEVYARRYFYPLISEFPAYSHLPSAPGDNLPVATEMTRRILALPIYPSLTEEDQDRVVDIIRSASRRP